MMPPGHPALPLLLCCLPLLSTPGGQDPSYQHHILCLSVFDWLNRCVACSSYPPPPPPLSLPASTPIPALWRTRCAAQVLCGANTDKEYRARRCPPDEWERRWAVHGIERVWRDDVLPCRVYLRHCVLAARSLSPAAAHSFLHETYLADRQTTVAAYLESRPEILEELPPLELINRYSG